MDKIGITEGGKKYLTAAAVTFLVYLGMKYVSPVVSPFLFAFLLAGVLNPAVRILHNKIKIRKSVLAGILLFVVGVLMVILLWVILSALTSF